jgi:uncharacterized membrane protein
MNKNTEEEKQFAKAVEDLIKNNNTVNLLTKISTKKGYSELIEFYEQHGIYTKEWLSFNVYAYLKEKPLSEVLDFIRKEQEILFNNISKKKVEQIETNAMMKP